MKEVRIIILDKEDLKQFGFAPRDIESAEFEDDSISFTLKESTKTVQTSKKKKRLGDYKGRPKGSRNKKRSKQAHNGIKICGKCLKKKDVSEFNKFKASVDGYQSRCRDCQNKKKVTSTNKKEKIKNVEVKQETITSPTPPREEFRELPLPNGTKDKNPMQQTVERTVGQNKIYTYAHIYNKLEKNDFQRKKTSRELGIEYKDVIKVIETHKLAKIDEELEGLDDF